MTKFINKNSETLLEIKTVRILGSTGSGSTIETNLSSNNIIILNCECDGYIATPYVINNKYYVAISKYMNIGNDLYAFGGVDKAVTVLIKYMLIK